MNESNKKHPIHKHNHINEIDKVTVMYESYKAPGVAGPGSGARGSVVWRGILSLTLAPPLLGTHDLEGRRMTTDKQRRGPTMRPERAAAYVLPHC